MTAINTPQAPDDFFVGDRVNIVDVRSPAGAVLSLPHGMHPLHCLHSAEPITRGCK